MVPARSSREVVRVLLLDPNNSIASRRIQRVPLTCQDRALGVTLSDTLQDSRSPFRYSQWSWWRKSAKLALVVMDFTNTVADTPFVNNLFWVQSITGFCR